MTTVIGGSQFGVISMSGQTYEDEKIDGDMEAYEREQQERCDHEWQRMGVLCCEDPIEKGYIGGSEIIMVTIRCHKCGKGLHLEGTVE
tara:strand:- start:472 stop:735 length:264 start_codon:yes stop_codon:yes gene_type:complete